MNKKFKTILTTVLMFVMSLCLIIGLTGCNNFVDLSCKHEYSNGSCSKCGEKDPTWAYTLSITNKEDLTAEWIEASATRELNVVITKDGVETTDQTYLIETSNSGVVSIGDDNKTLTAQGGGTATITVTFTDDFDHVLQDSVEITVIPYLRGVSIANKNALQEVWILGEAERAIEITFNPAYYNENLPTYTVTSSDPSVVEVGSNNATLTAKKIGTATITVTAGEYSDNVEMTVRPAFEGLKITNKEELTAVWNDWTEIREIEIALTPSDYYTVENTEIEVSFSENGLIQANGLALTAKKVGTVTVTVSALGQSDSFTVEIERSAPVVTLIEMSGFDAEEGVLNGIENSEIELPRATASTCDGTDISLDIEMEVIGSGAYLYDGKIVASQGEYTVLYTAKDTENESLVTEKEITVKVWRDTFAWTDGNWQWIDQYAADKEQAVTVSVYGYQTAAFNVEPGKYYYAEAIYEEIGGIPGMAHYIVNADGTYNTKRWLASNVANWGGYDFKFVDFDTTLFAANNGGAWTMQEGEKWLNVIYSWQLTNYRGLKANENPNIHKIAIVRMGDWFITFWNDQYVMMATNEYYANENTIPGLFSGPDGSDLKVTNMTWITGKDAVAAKVAELTHNGKDVNTTYSPDSWAIQSINTNNRNFTSNEISSERGVNYDYTKIDSDFNDGMVSNYVWFDGDFMYEWDYLNTDANMNVGGTSRRMFAEVRNRMWYGDMGIQFGAQYNDNGEFSKVLLNAPGMSVENYKWYESSKVDASEGIHFIISRKLYSDYAEYTMIAQSIANPDQYQLRTVTLSENASKSTDGKTSFGDWNKPVTIQWHNWNVKGQYSNIKWNNSATEHENHIYAAPTYSVNETLTECTAKRSCIFENCGHSESETVTVSANVTTQRDCTTAEETTYTATFTNAAFEKQSVTLQTADALGHKMTTVQAKAPTETEYGWNEYQKCERENCDYTEGYLEIPKLGSAPILTFGEAETFTATEEGGTLLGFENKGIALPAATAISCDNVDISADIIVTITPADVATFLDGTFTAPKGTYEITYFIEDPNKAELNTTKVITVTVTRDPLINLDNTWSYSANQQYVADSEQVLVNTANGFQIAALNMAASDYYYAEAEFNASNYASGMANFNVDSNGKIITTSFLTSLVEGSDKNFKLVDFQTTGDKAWNTGENDTGRDVTYMYQLVNYHGLKENTKNTDSNKVNKMAVARIGDYFITFWNDQYVMMAVKDKYNSGLTVPGLFLAGSGNVTVTNIVYFSGADEVNAKVAELTHNGKDVNTSYVPDTWALNSLNGNNTNFKTYEINETNGLGLRYTFTNGSRDFNDGMVSNYVWFDGDFTFEWDYRAASNTGNTNAAAGERRMFLEIRDNWWYDSLGIQFGAQYNADGTFSKALLNNEKFAEDYKWWESSDLDVNADEKIHFKVTRKLYSDYAEFTMTVTSTSNPNSSLSRTITIGGNASKSTDKTTSIGAWNRPVVLQWHNWNVKGYYTNISWKNSVD